ncbi:hypothetical protein HD806DRAFT_502387 [Xylariaceae sp. AK1471]|nr:hypothetical protein HD806DRAFT_502387 [Xylariaceae sp. AK1471]
MVRPAMVGNQPPPGTVSVQAPGIQGQAQVNVDPNMTAVLIGSAVGAALRPDHPQQSQGGRAQGYAQPDHNSHAESYGAENHGYSTENHAGAHEPAHDSYYTAQAPTTYTDNNNMAADTTYADSTSHSMNNATYVDNTDVTVVNNTYVNNTDVAVNNSTYADNSMYGNTDTTYTDTSYVDTTAYGSTDTTYVDASYYDSTAYGTTEVTVDMNVESYTDGNTTTFSMEESINVASSSDFGVTSGDYSGGGWGDWFSE